MFGEYVKVHEKNKTKNWANNQYWSTGNIQGLMKFMCVETERKVLRQSYTKLSMPDSILKTVEGLAEKDIA